MSESQILAILLAGAIGDAVGAHAEGSSSPSLPHDETPLRITDDTQLTLATAESITEHRQILPEKIAERFTLWYRQRRFTGLGSSTLKALRELDAGGHWATVGAVGERAAGNGAAIRIAPLAFLLDPENDLDRRTIRDVCRISHRHDEAYLGALALIHSIRFAMVRGNLSGELFDFLSASLPDSVVRDRFRSIQSESLSPYDYVARFSSSGYVADSVPLAILSAVYFSDFETLLPEIISLGGDTDSNTSMACQLLAASQDSNSLPANWFNRLEDVSQIKQIVHDFSLSICSR